MRLKWFGAALLAFAVAAPASAQTVTIQFGRPQAYGFSNNYPWFNDVSQYQGDQTFQYFLAYHPDISRALALNPGLLYNAAWRSDNPALQQYLESHPYEWQALNNANWSTGPAETQWGYDDSQHQWRDAYWWHQNDPNWFYDNHQDWSSLDSRWLVEDGAYDQQHQWHYGEWWYNQNPSWVTTSHPMWLSQHQNWSNQSEQQTFRQQHAMVAVNPQQRVANQRQANVQQQANIQSVQRQQQVNQRQASVQRNVRQQNQRQDQRQANVQQQQSTQMRNQSAQQTHQQARPQAQPARRQARPQARATRPQARPQHQAARQQARPQQHARQQSRGAQKPEVVAHAGPNKR